MPVEILIAQILLILRKNLRGYNFFLFGSWARGDARETSDLDIGILGKESVPWPIMTKVLQEIDELPTLRKIDVVDFNAVDSIFQENALKYAKQL